MKPFTRLAELRVGLGLSQKTLSVKINVSLTTLAKLENATRASDLKGLRFDLLWRVCQALGVTPADLIPALRGD